MPFTQYPQLVTCPLTNRRVLIAPGRAARPIMLPHSEPHHRKARHQSRPDSFCPFCPGNEWDTPNESYAVRDSGSQADGSGWSLRVVPNKFPAVVCEGRGQFGIHEVVIPTPAHEGNPSKMMDQQFTQMLIAWRERLCSFARDERLAYAQIFQNVGAEAGASLEHVHSQIVATPFLPDAIQLELDGSHDYFNENQKCLFCELLNHTPQAHLILQDESWKVLCPPAPRFGYEMWIMPTKHQSSFETLTIKDAESLAVLMKKVFTSIDSVLSEPAYNVILHTSPFRMGELPFFHWHLEVIPRTARAAGYEWGTDIFINAFPPEVTAREIQTVFSQSSQ